MMKATINGHEVEGTPDEIAALMMIMQTEMTAAIKGVDITADIPRPKWELGQYGEEIRTEEPKTGLATEEAIKPNDQFTHTYPFSSVVRKCEGPCYCTGACMGYPPGYGLGSIKYDKQNQQQYRQDIWMQNDAQPIMGMGDVIGDTKPKRWDVYTRMDGNGDLRMCEADLPYEEARKLCDDNGGWIMFERTEK